jgi:hypothetical protein
MSRTIHVKLVEPQPDAIKISAEEYSHLRACDQRAMQIDRAEARRDFDDLVEEAIALLKSLRDPYNETRLDWVDARARLIRRRRSV